MSDDFIGRFSPARYVIRPELRQNAANDTMEEIIFAYVRSHADLDDAEAAAFIESLVAHPNLHQVYELFQRLERFTRRAVREERARKSAMSAREGKRKRATEKETRLLELDARIRAANPTLWSKAKRAQHIKQKKGCPKMSASAIARKLPTLPRS
jgi:hypothetical protein